jgi:hypothetical protein
MTLEFRSGRATYEWLLIADCSWPFYLSSESTSFEATLADETL